MEPLMTPPPAGTTDGHTLPARLSHWVTTAERRLRVGGEWPVAAALREGMALAVEELRVEREAWQETGALAEARAAQLGDCFAWAPVALLVTTADGRVCEANVEAQWLLDRPRGLAGQLLVRSVAVEDRGAFRALLRALADAPGARELPLRLGSDLGPRRNVVATVRSRADHAGTPLLHWALRDDRRADDDLL